MRRKDRQMDKEFGMSIIDAASYGIVSMIDQEGKPYGLPLSLVRDGDILYFHAAKDGKKIDSLQRHSSVWITFVGQVEVPELYDQDQLEAMREDQAKASLFISSVFTTEFESAMVSGRVKKLEEDKEKIKAMKLICEKYTPSKMAYFDTAIQTGLARVAVYAVEIKEITAKRKKYNLEGKEMKESCK